MAANIKAGLLVISSVSQTVAISAAPESSFLISIPAISQAGAFVFAREDSNIGVRAITHPSGYTGAGGTLNIKVCIRPTSSNTANLDIIIPFLHH